ncbi:hypothetical protein M2322_004823 [Rhodoblastus acidophilus]|uniref:DUF2019 domain-containing protein n=1 Tax=Rhodoblastus acidophilus TaxID=1074 RepID=UPI002225809A|nr:DUF2019 domain-containing protein [Rhodoblastus acidophilus]MCW2319254.1 hypothetical protein [Rhodoblastus acidophilus]
MTETYAAMSIDELINVFKNACLAQDDLLFFPEDVKIYNEKMNVLFDVKQELQARGPDARRSLQKLLGNDNAQVRFQAATFVYPVAREEAKKCLQDLASVEIFDVSFRARMTLHRLEEVPDCLDH